MMPAIAPMVVSGAGVLTLVIGAAATRRVRESFRCALDLWFAAGAIRLGTAPGMEAIGIAAVILAVRQLVSWRFFGNQPSRRSDAKV